MSRRIILATSLAAMSLFSCKTSQSSTALSSDELAPKLGECKSEVKHYNQKEFSFYQTIDDAKTLEACKRAAMPSSISQRKPSFRKAFRYDCSIKQTINGDVSHIPRTAATKAECEELATHYETRSSGVNASWVSQWKSSEWIILSN